MKELRWSIALLLVTLFSAACGTKQAATGNSNQAAGGQVGSATASLYQSVGCAICHGAEGKGNAQMKDIPNFTDAAWQKKTGDDEMANIIKNGKPPMPAYKTRLTDEQISAMIAYIRAFAK